MNTDGFFYPEIDQKKCVQCGKCISICPVLNDFDYSLPGISKVYAGKNKNYPILERSSSGGIFFLLAERVILDGGIVFGAEFASDFSVMHSLASTIDEVKNFCGSKYSESDVGYTYKKCKELLKKGIKVLYSGTPCQIAGLLSYLDKQYVNLITVDFICHGIPSPVLWNKYIQYRQKVDCSDNISSINFRSKKFSWENYSLDFKYNNHNEYIASNYHDVYLNFFLDNKCLRESCYNCKFRKVHRKSDFTLADFWGIDTVCRPNEFDSQSGVSLIFANSLKAESIINEIPKSLCLLKKLSEKEITMAIKINSSLIKSPRRPIMRNKLSSIINKNNLFDSEYGKVNTVGIINHSFSNNNYGALLVAFAMEHLVENCGFKPLTIYLKLDGIGTEPFNSFRNTYLHTTKPLSIAHLKKLNKFCDTFISGSDQVWRDWWNNENIFRQFFLDFTDYSKNNIAYAASFGLDRFECNEKEMSGVRNLLSSYSAISVREFSGQDILKKNFHLYSEFVLDPTLMIDKEFYEEIIKNSTLTLPNNYWTIMFFKGESSDLIDNYNLIEHLASENRSNVMRIYDDNLNLRSHEDWLKIIKYSNFNIIDSYHGLLFSIIFHIPFLCIANTEGGNERVNTILKICGLEKRFIINTYLDEYTINQQLAEKIDWQDVEQRLDKYRVSSKEFIQFSLNKNINYNSKVKINTLNLHKYKIFIKHCIRYVLELQNKVVNKFKK
jgi:ferredoxin